MFAFKGSYQAEVSLVTDAWRRIPAPHPSRVSLLPRAKWRVRSASSPRRLARRDATLAPARRLWGSVHVSSSPTWPQTDILIPPIPLPPGYRRWERERGVGDSSVPQGGDVLGPHQRGASPEHGHDAAREVFRGDVRVEIPSMVGISYCVSIRGVCDHG